MDVAIFGATGKLGRCAVRAAVDAGHTVRAFVRDPARLEPIDGVSATVGDLTAHESIRSVVASAQGVLWCVGAYINRFDQPQVFKAALGQAIAAMTAGERGRIVVISGAAIDYPGDAPRRLGHRFMLRLVRTLAPQIMGVNDAQRDVLLASDVAWVAVRPMTLGDGPSAGPVHADGSHLTGGKIPRTDVARFMVAQLVDDTWLRRAPYVSV